MGEFDVIERYFQRQNAVCNTPLAIGDDCALLEIPPTHHLAITTDTLTVGTHFLPSISPADLAYKSVAVNLSDLAAMGATPKWISLALTLESVDEHWLAAFSTSLFHILDQYNVALIGGDTTKGATAITITAQGLLPKGKGLFRHKAKVGDWLYVSGTLGDSAGGLAHLLAQKPPQTAAEKFLFARHFRPTPRVALGQMLTQYSTCGIDLSDGLLADLGHILKRSQCGAEIWLENLPISASLRECFPDQAENFALGGGENYELFFTVPDCHKAAMEHAAQKIGVPCHCIGKIIESGLRLTRHGVPVPLPAITGFNHFQ